MPVHLPPPERAVVHAVNVERAAHGLRPLRVARSLTRAAEIHSRDLLRQGRVGHDSSDGASFSLRIARAGRFREAGEVVAFSPRHSATARAVVRLWMRSPIHRQELLSPNYRLLGVGRVRGPLGGRRGTLVTADLATR